MSSPASPTSEAPAASLPAFQVGVIDLFVSLLRLLGIPRSVGEIYGLLYSTPEPLSQDDIVDRLQLSKGSASQGMKLLRGLGAVKLVYVPGDRRDRFTAETELKKLVQGFYREELAPRVESGVERLANLGAAAEELPEAERAFAAERLKKLAQWHTRAAALFPILESLFEE